jgi:hypothetical protein
VRQRGFSRAELMLVAFVASLLVILEARYHAFVHVDELVLSALGASGAFSHPALNTESDAAAEVPTPRDASCKVPHAKYVVVLLGPAENDRETTPAVSASDRVGGPGVAEHAPPLWLRTVQAIQRMEPAVLAIDLDMTNSGWTADPITGYGPRRSSGPMSTHTRLAFVAMPHSRADPASERERALRNDWLRAACRSPRVAVATANVGQTRLARAVVQFYWERVSRPGEPPPAFPGLGQVTRLLAKGLDATNDKHGPGMICAYLRETAGAERIPFIDEPITPAEKVDPRFFQQLDAEDRFSVEWINPVGVSHDISVITVDSDESLANFEATAHTCIGEQQIVFVGRRLNVDDTRDAFATAVGDETPGVMVHAMTARSSDRLLRNALALNAAVDLLIGYLLAIGAKRLRLPRLQSSDLFAVRLIPELIRLNAMLLVAAIAVLVSYFALLAGVFLNPLVVGVGMVLHTILDRFVENTRVPRGAVAEAAPPVEPRLAPRLPKLYALLPRPAMSERGVWRYVDRAIYGVSLCLVLVAVLYAVWLVAARVSIVFS